jgi:hypothetical protein
MTSRMHHLDWRRKHQIGQTKHRPECQGCSDCQNRVMWLTSACCAGLSAPSCNGLVREPDRETSPPAQGRVVLGQFVIRGRCFGMR